MHRIFCPWTVLMSPIGHIWILCCRLMDIWIRLSYPLFCLPLWHREPIRENYIIWVIRNPLYVFCITRSYSIPLVSAFRLLRKMPGAGMSFWMSAIQYRPKLLFPILCLWTPDAVFLQNPENGTATPDCHLSCRTTAAFLTIRWRQPLDILTLRLPSLLWIGWANYFINIIIPTWRISVPIFLKTLPWVFPCPVPIFNRRKGIVISA